MKRAKADVEDRVAALAAIEAALETKVADPSATPDAPEWSVLGTPPAAAVRAQAVTEHNDQVRRPLHGIPVQLEVPVADGSLAWFRTVDHNSQALIGDAIDQLVQAGPKPGSAAG